MSENCRMCLALNLLRELTVLCGLVDWLLIYSGSTVLGYFVSLLTYAMSGIIFGIFEVQVCITVSQEMLYLKNPSKHTLQKRIHFP